MEMQPIKVPEFKILRGEKAIEALNAFIDELESQRGEELTDKQANALIKLAKGLISSIEAETRLNTPNKETDLVRHVKKTIMKCVSGARACVSSVFAGRSSI
jgi:hypothetical protein